MNSSEIALGVIISIITSLLDVLYFNLKKRSYLQEAPKTQSQSQRVRFCWLLSFLLFLSSQVLKFTVVFQRLDLQLAALLSLLSLVFNLILARFIVGTIITWYDLVGIFVILGANITIVFIGTYLGEFEKRDEKDHGDKFTNNYFSESSKAYLITTNILVLVGLVFSWYLKRLLRRPDQFSNSIFSKFSLNIHRSLGVFMTTIGGILASETFFLVYIAFKVSKISSGSYDSNMDFLFYMLIAIITIGAILLLALWLHCLNYGLRQLDSISIIPIFISVFNVFLLLNVMSYFNILDSIVWWFYFSLAICVLFLLPGTFILLYKEKPTVTPVPQVILHSSDETQKISQSQC